MGVFEGWIGRLGVTSFSILAWSIPACFNKVIWNSLHCGAPASPRREFVWGGGSGALCGLLELVLGDFTGKGLSIWAGQGVWVLTVHLWGYYGSSYGGACGFSGRLNSLWLFWKIKKDFSLWAVLRVLEITWYFLCQWLGKLLSSSQESRSPPVGEESKGHCWQEIQRCCRALLQCMSGLAGTMFVLLQASKGKTPCRTQPEKRR